MNIKQAKTAIINEWSKQMGFTMSLHTEIDFHWVMGVKIGNYSVCEAVEKMKSDYTIQC